MLTFLWNACFIAASIWGPDVVPHQTVTPYSEIGDCPPSYPPPKAAQAIPAQAAEVGRAVQFRLEVTMAKVNPKALPILRCQWPQNLPDGAAVGEFPNPEKLLEMLMCLKTAELAKILAEPRILTVNGGQAYLSSGDATFNMTPTFQAGRTRLDVNIKLPPGRLLCASTDVSKGAALVFSIFDEKEGTIILVTPRVETPASIERIGVDFNQSPPVKIVTTVTPLTGPPPDSCKVVAPTRTIPLTPVCQPQPDAHRVDVGDTLGIVIDGVFDLKPHPMNRFELPTTGYPFVVNADGALALPELKRMVKVSGMTIPAVRDAITKAYMDEGILERKAEVHQVRVSLLKPHSIRTSRVETPCPIERIGVDFNQSPPVKVVTTITPLPGPGGCKVVARVAPQAAPSVPPPPPFPVPQFGSTDAKPAITGLDQMFSKAFEQMFNQGVVTSDARNNNQLSVADVIALSKNGLADAVIIRQLKRSNSTYELSANDLIRLSESAVSQEVIRAMQKRRK